MKRLGEWLQHNAWKIIIAFLVGVLMATCVTKQAGADTVRPALLDTLLSVKYHVPSLQITDVDLNQYFFDMRPDGSVSHYEVLDVNDNLVVEGDQ